MKKYIIILTAMLFLFSCGNNTRKDTGIVNHFASDTVAQRIIYENLDTLEGRWILKLEKQEAVKLGISGEIYDFWIEKIKEVNDFNEDLKKENPEIIINFNFPYE